MAACNSLPSLLSYSYRHTVIQVITQYLRLTQNLGNDQNCYASITSVISTLRFGILLGIKVAFSNTPPQVYWHRLICQGTRPFFCARSCATQAWIAYNRRTLIKSRVTSRTCSRPARLMHRQVAHSTCKTRSICTRHIRLTEMRKVIAGRALPRQALNRQRDQHCIRLQITSSSMADNQPLVPVAYQSQMFQAYGAARQNIHSAAWNGSPLQGQSNAAAPVPPWMPPQQQSQSMAPWMLPQQRSQPQQYSEAQADARCQTPSSLSVWPSNGDPRLLCIHF